MKEMKIEKGVELHQEFETIEDIKCFCKLDYVAEEKGIRAQGTITVTGLGIRNGLSHEINEEIELDVLAPYEKIDSQQAFKVLLEDYQVVLKDDVLNMTLNFMVLGLLEEEEKPTVVEVEKHEPSDSNEEAAIEDLLDDQENIKVVQRFVIAQRNDTYQSIAERYHLSEKELIARNHNKPLEYKSLVVLPESL